MRTYTIPVPEFFLNDRELSSREKEIMLVNHFHDLFHMYLGKLVDLTDTTPLTEEKEKKLRSMFDELIRVKTMIKERK